MNKIGLILDSSSGLNTQELEKIGVGFIPVMITVDKQDYRANDEITTNKVYELMRKDKVLRTSSPKPIDIIKAFDKAIEKHDKTIYVGVSTEMSSTINAAKTIAKEEKYKDRIFVFDSKLYAPYTQASINNFLELLSSTDDIELIFEIMNEFQQTILSYIIPGNIKHLYNGGRISKIQYLAGKLLKIRPIIKIDNGFIDNKEVQRSRSVSGAFKKIRESYHIFEDKIKKYKFDEIKHHLRCMVFDSDNEKNVEDNTNASKDYNWVNENNVDVLPIGVDQAAHVGPDSMGIGWYISLEYFIKKHLNK